MDSEKNTWHTSLTMENRALFSEIGIPLSSSVHRPQTYGTFHWYAKEGYVTIIMEQLLVP